MTTSIVQGFINSIPDKRIARAFSEIFSRITPSKVDTALTAHAGGTKAAALSLKSTCSFHDVTTVATAADSILLPPAKEGEFHFVKNSGAASMQVFGQGTDTIDSVATGTGVAQLAGDGVLYYCLVPGNWIRLGGVSATEVFTTITATTGNITTVNATNIDAGASGTAGSVDVFPATASKGKLAITVTDQTGDTTVSLVAGAMAAARTITLRDPGAAASILTTTDATAAATTATAAEISNQCDVSTRIVNVTTTPLAVTEAAHSGKTLVLDKADGLAITLPAASAGLKFRFIVKTTFTGAASIKSVSGADIMIGYALMGNDSDNTVVRWPVIAGDTADTIDLLGTSNSTGGLAGQEIEIEGLAANLWFVKIVGDAAGTEATPFTNTVA